jgi:hypothetical protein
VGQRGVEFVHGVDEGFVGHAGTGAPLMTGPASSSARAGADTIRLRVMAGLFRRGP